MLQRMVAARVPQVHRASASSNMSGMRTYSEYILTAYFDCALSEEKSINAGRKGAHMTDESAEIAIYFGQCECKKK